MGTGMIYSFLGCILDPFLVVPAYVTGLYASGKWLLIWPICIALAVSLMISLLDRSPESAIIYRLVSAGLWTAVAYGWRRLWASRRPNRDPLDETIS